jgi:hypothetical protein
VVAFCEKKQAKQHFAYLNVRRTVVRFFHLVKLANVDHMFAWDYKQNLHFDPSIPYV